MQKATTTTTTTTKIEDDDEWETAAIGIGDEMPNFNSLDGRNWLNDDVINPALSMFVSKGQYSDRIIVFNTYFYLMLELERDVSKWHSNELSRLSIQDKLLVIPLHINGNHWALATVNIAFRRIQYYDSMFYTAMDVYHRLIKIKQYMENKFPELNGGGWNFTYRISDLPKQHNQYDCGVFMLMNARLCMEEFHKKANISIFTRYGQQDIEHIRIALKQELITWWNQTKKEEEEENYSSRKKPKINQQQQQQQLEPIHPVV